MQNLSIIRRLAIPFEEGLNSVRIQFGLAARTSNGSLNWVCKYCPSPKLQSRVYSQNFSVHRLIVKRTYTSMASTNLPPAVKAKLDQIPDAKIDASGRFKYILIKVFATDSDGKHVDENSKLVVRGRADCPYHGDIFDKFQEETSGIDGIDEDILGGGRIERTGNKIFVFGYSQGYGKAGHTLTVEILKRDFPNHEITWSDEGY